MYFHQIICDICQESDSFGREEATTGTASAVIHGRTNSGRELNEANWWRNQSFIQILSSSLDSVREAAYLDTFHKTTAQIFSARLLRSPTGFNPDWSFTNRKKESSREIREKSTHWAGPAEPNDPPRLAPQSPAPKPLPESNPNSGLLLLTTLLPPTLSDTYREPSVALSCPRQRNLLKSVGSFLRWEIGAPRSCPSGAAQVPGAPSYRPPDSWAESAIHDNAGSNFAKSIHSKLAKRIHSNLAKSIHSNLGKSKNSQRSIPIPFNSFRKMKLFSFRLLILIISVATNISFLSFQSIFQNYLTSEDPFFVVTSSFS